MGDARPISTGNKSIVHVITDNEAQLQGKRMSEYEQDYTTNVQSAYEQPTDHYLLSC